MKNHVYILHITMVQIRYHFIPGIVPRMHVKFRIRCLVKFGTVWLGSKIVGDYVYLDVKKDAKLCGENITLFQKSACFSD